MIHYLIALYLLYGVFQCGLHYRSQTEDYGFILKLSYIIFYSVLAGICDFIDLFKHKRVKDYIFYFNATFTKMDIKNKRQVYLALCYRKNNYGKIDNYFCDRIIKKYDLK